MVIEARPHVLDCRTALAALERVNHICFNGTEDRPAGWVANGRIGYLADEVLRAQPDLTSGP
jgi:hypothetical protein